MPLSGTSGVEERETIFYGQWPRVYAVKDPLGAATEVYLGAVTEGSLSIAREEIEFFDTNFPRRLSVSVPSQVTMTFSGTFHEIRYRLLHFLVGDDDIESVDRYVDIGAGCGFADIDVNLFGERIICSGSMIVFKMHRARATGALEIGAGDDFIGIPSEIKALDDSEGDLGGSTTSPLGFLWLSNAA